MTAVRRLRVVEPLPAPLAVDEAEAPGLLARIRGLLGLTAAHELNDTPAPAKPKAPKPKLRAVPEGALPEWTAADEREWQRAVRLRRLGEPPEAGWLERRRFRWEKDR